MKKLLTVACTGKLNVPYEVSEIRGVNFVCPKEGESAAAFLTNEILSSGAKYFICALGDISATAENIKKFVKFISLRRADIITYSGGYALKTALLKGAVNKNLPFTVGNRMTALISAKTVAAAPVSPIEITRAELFLESDDSLVEISAVNEIFSKTKGKLRRAVYTVAFDDVVNLNIEFYLRAYVQACKDKNDEIILEFDRQLKQNVVTYHATDARFPVKGALSRLRKNGFKRSYLMAQRFKMYLKKQLKK